MINLSRHSLPKASVETRENLMRLTAEFVCGLTQPMELIFFGSIVTENFDECSDVDVVAIYETREIADQARRIIYRSKRPVEINRSIEVLCVEEVYFESKANLGGVYFVAKNEGRRYYKIESEK